MRPEQPTPSERSGRASLPSRIRRRLRARLAGLRGRLAKRDEGPKLAGQRLLQAFAASSRDAFFVEIGANDGRKYDHLTALIEAQRWRGIMVEPVPFVFERLRENYGRHERIALENVAIADRDGQLPFYHLAEASDEELERLPPYYDALGSFSRDVLVSHVDEIPDIERRVVEIRVPCLTFDSLCRRHGDPQIDLLLIDVEGYDAELLRTIDLERHRPRLVVYEHYHLDPDDRRASRERVEGTGYLTFEEGFDTFCLAPDGDYELARLWPRLDPVIPPLSVHDPAPPEG